MKWIIDDMMADSYYGGNFLSSLKTLGRDVQIFEDNPFNFTKMDKLETEDTTLAYGSIQFIERLVRENDKVSVFANFNSFDANKYLSYVDPSLLLSDDYMYITMSFLLDDMQRTKLKAMFGNEVFIRPNSSRKIFSGQIINLDDKRNIVNTFKMSGSNKDTIIIVSSVKKVIGEYRTFVSRKNGVLTASSYFYDKRGSEARGCPEKVRIFAETIMEELIDNAPDKLLVIDVAEYEKGDGRTCLGLVELNAPSTSGIYACDATPIILEMEQIIKEEWDME
jgi:hypothetical protein